MSEYLPSWRNSFPSSVVRLLPRSLPRHAQRDLYYPETFFLDDLLSKRAANGLITGDDPIKRRVREHLDNFKLLLLIFDRICLPLDNFRFLASEYSARVAMRLLDRPEFRALAERGLIYTNEHDRHDLFSSWELYGARLGSWLISPVAQAPSFDQVKGIPSEQSKPFDASDRFLTRLQSIIAYVKADGMLTRGQEVLLDRAVGAAMDAYNDGTISVEHLAKYLLKAEGSDFPSDKAEWILRAINIAFFETFPQPSEGTYAYAVDSIAVTDPMRQFEALRSVIYAPQFLRPWLYKFVASEGLHRLLDGDDTVITSIRSFPSWRPFMEEFHGSFVEKIVRAFTDRFWANGSTSPELVSPSALLDAETRIERLFDFSLSDFHTSVKIAPFLSTILSYRYSRRLAQRAFFPAMGQFLTDLNDFLRKRPD
jgi:hypothetical protein